MKFFLGGVSNFYHTDERPEVDMASYPENMASHTDPGMFTVKVLGDVEGLQIFDQKHSRWIQLEGGPQNETSIVLFNCEQLQVVSEDKYVGTAHSVSGAAKARLSLVYELRF